MIFNRDEARVNFALDTRAKDVNKAMFDHLFERKVQIETVFGGELSWRRMEDKKVSLIGCSAPFDGHNRDTWSDMIAWLVEHVQRMRKPSIRKCRRSGLCENAFSKERQSTMCQRWRQISM